MVIKVFPVFGNFLFLFNIVIFKVLYGFLCFFVLLCHSFLFKRLISSKHLRFKQTRKLCHIAFYRISILTESGGKILSRLLGGESCALVTDAGMPAISDPGEDLVRLCAANGVPVQTVPGPSALISALALSGLPTRRFCFEGFLPVNNKERSAHLDSLKGEKRTMLFYEAPHKLLRTLEDMLAVFGDRDLAVCRELTKLHEETLRTTLSGAIAPFTEKPPKGEFVLVVRGAEDEPPEQISREAALALVEKYRSEGLSLKDAAKKAAADSGFSKNELYSMALESR